MKQSLDSIAQEYLDIPTLEERKSDSLDFHDVAVWQLKAALARAYLNGLEDQAHALNYRRRAKIWGHDRYAIIPALAHESFGIDQIDTVLRSYGVTVKRKILEAFIEDKSAPVAELTAEQVQDMRVRENLYSCYNQQRKNG